MIIRHSYLNKIGIFLVLSYLVSACALQKPEIQTADLKYTYALAVKNAEKAEPQEISKNLIAVVPWNQNLTWKKQEQKPWVLVATWTNYDGYDDKIGQSIALSREIWVTTVPEVKDFCKELTENKTLRLEQRLGLPANANKTKFVEMWVEPSNLFRPSPDPEITDSEAEINFRLANRFLNTSDDYIKWFNDLKMKSYGTNGYPWTRLGYTYDWGQDDHIGLSEFVIIKGATVEINAVSATSEYCR